MGSPIAAKFTTTSHSLINGYSRSTEKSPLSKLRFVVIHSIYNGNSMRSFFQQM